MEPVNGEVGGKFQDGQLTIVEHSSSSSAMYFSYLLTHLSRTYRSQALSAFVWPSTRCFAQGAETSHMTKNSCPKFICSGVDAVGHNITMPFSASSCPGIGASMLRSAINPPT
jgi:hypothetical protein